MTQAATAPSSADSFESQLVTLVGKQPRRMFVPLFLAIVLIAGMASRTTPMPWILAWFGLATAVMLARVFVQNTSRLVSLAPSRRLQITVALVAVSGITHGLSLFFFPRMSLFEQAVLSMMLVGLAAGSVATAAGYRPIFLAYIIPTLGPLAVLWAMSPELRDVGWVQGLMAVLIVLFAFVLDALARDTFRVLRESYEIRLERAALNQELRHALDTAEAANRAKTRFLASASHDLRQPMQTLSLFAAALAMRPLDERSRDIALNMNEALQDLTAELDALLDVSKLDAGTVTPHVGAFALRPLLARVVEVFTPAAQDRKLQLTLRCGEEVWVRTDRKLLDRVVRNLVENAIKYTEQGSVTIEVSKDGSSYVLAIADTGCGIAESEQDRVFEEFYQIRNPERDRRRGLGLGLAIVRRLIGLLQLQLSMTSAPGEGTQFTIALPAAPVTLAPTQYASDEQTAHTAVRVLLLDDEEGVRRGMQTLLQESGSEVAVAATIEEAMEILKRGAIHVLIADFRLRGADNGLHAIRLMREIQPDLPALLMTGETAPERLREAHDAGIPVIHKPVMPQLLMREIQRIASTILGSEANGERKARIG
jgi:signal transduction histidine kinase